MTDRRSLTTIVVGLVITLGCASARPNIEARPDFSGPWTLDTTETMGGGRGDASGNMSGGGGGAGGGTGLGPPSQEMTIQQSITTLLIAETTLGGIITLTYRLDGSKVTNAMPVGRGGSAQAVYTSRWDGATLLTSITRATSTVSGVVNTVYRERRYLAADSSMVVETTIQGRPAGRKTVYRKTA